MSEDKWTEARVLALLAERYSSERGEWAFFPLIRGHTGFRGPGRENYLDAFAMNCWPSKGYLRVALEVKVSRSDWLRELRDPGKRARAMELANEFWFVAPSGVIKPDEVPDGCGWLQVTKGGLRTKKAAKQREVDDLPMNFVASLLRTEATKDRLTLKQLKAFRYAGEELTVEEFLEKNDQAVQTSAQRMVRDLLFKERMNLPEMKLVETVKRCMRGTKAVYGVPRPEDFEAWLASVTGFGGDPPLEKLQEIKDHARKAISSILDLERQMAGRA